jgi:hypothetical protein
MRYDQVHDGDWVKPIRKGYRLMCCDCGLVHILDFALTKWGHGKAIQFRASRDKKATAAARRRRQSIKKLLKPTIAVLELLSYRAMQANNPYQVELKQEIERLKKLR